MTTLVLPLSLVELRVVEAIRLKHDDLVVTFIVLVLRVARDPALRGDLARAFRRVLMLIVITVVLVVLIATSWLAVNALRRLTLGETTRDSALAEITAIGQVLESHLTRLRVHSAGIAASSVDD